jgi:hypothetical protein
MLTATLVHYCSMACLQDGSDLTKLQAVHAQLLQEHAALKAEVEGGHTVQASQEADIRRVSSEAQPPEQPICSYWCIAAEQEAESCWLVL